MTHENHRPPTIADILYESFYSGAIGGAVVALFFLVLDTVGGQPLFTPSLVGSVLFFGEAADAVSAVRLDAVALTTIVHLVAFMLLGLLASQVVRFVEARATSFSASAGALFVLASAGFLMSASVLMPGVAGRIGAGSILVANALTAVVMTAFLRKAHFSAEAEQGEGADAGNDVTDLSGTPA
jgi:hypothetical protein